MTKINYYKQLTDIIKSNPDLIFQNKGYEELSDKVIEENRVAFDKVTEILKTIIDDFIKFQNFIRRKDGTISIRCQTKWDTNFTGVCYIPIESLKPLFDKSKLTKYSSPEEVLDYHPLIVRNVVNDIILRRHIREFFPKYTKIVNINDLHQKGLETAIRYLSSRELKQGE